MCQKSQFVRECVMWPGGWCHWRTSSICASRRSKMSKCTTRTRDLLRIKAKQYLEVHMAEFDKMQWEVTCNSEPANISRCLSTVAPVQYRKWAVEFWWFRGTDWSEMSTGQCLRDAFFDFLHCHHACASKSWSQACRDRGQYEVARM